MLGVVSIFTYGMEKGRQALAAAGIRAVSLTDIDAVAAAAAEDGRIAPQDIQRILKFRDNPQDESWFHT